MSSLNARRMFPLLILLLSLGCGGDSSTPPTPADPDVTDATLSLTSVVSLARVDVLGLNPPDAKRAQDYRVRVSAAGSDDFNLILDHDGEDWFFYAPLHPETPGNGGSVQVRITDGDNSSSPHGLELTALPEAPGTFAALVATVREHLEQRAQWAGTSIDALKALPADEVPPALLPLKLSQAYLDSDEDENDLTDLAANTNGFLTTEEVDLLDRLFGAFDLESVLRADIDDGHDLPSLPPLDKKSPGAVDLCINAGPEIETAPELSIYMTRSAVAQFGADPNSEAGRTLAFGATALTGMGMLSGPAGKTAAIGATVIAAVQGATEAVAGLLPSRFESIECVVDQTSFNEDDPGAATYSNVEVVAESTGWTADQTLSNTLINALGAYMSIAGRAQVGESSLARDVSLLGIGTGAGELFGDSGIIEFCSQRWTIDISSPIYSTAQSMLHKFTVDIPAQRVTPKEAGSDQLRVAAQSTQFGGREIHTDVDMVVNAIHVGVTPADIYVSELGETVSVTATIANADLETMRWTPEWGTWEDGQSDETNGPRTRPLKTPTDADAYPFLVTVESLSRQGVRSSGLPPRVGFATIHNGAQPTLRLSPADTCIHPGETVQYSAEVTGFAEGEYNINWAITEGWGSIDQNGLYRAPSGGSTNDVVTATVVEDTTAYDTAGVDVGACNCSLDINISGAYVWYKTSSQAAYSVSDFGGLFYQFYFGFDLDGPPSISAFLPDLEDAGGPAAPVPGDTGNWPVSFAFTTGTQTWSASPLAEHGGVTLTITEFTETSMTGYFTGTAVQLDQNGEVSSRVNIDVGMRAGLWLDGWPCE